MKQDKTAKTSGRNTEPRPSLLVYATLALLTCAVLTWALAPVLHSFL